MTVIDRSQARIWISPPLPTPAMVRTAVLAGLLGLAAPATGATLSATPETAKTVLARAQPDDTVAISGDVGSVVLNGRKGLTLDLSAATLDGLQIKGSSHIAVVGGRFRPTSWAGAVYVINSDNVSVTAPDIQGAGGSPGVTFRESSDVALSGARIDRARVAVSLVEVTGATIRGNALIGFAIDGLDVNSSHKVRIEQNVCAGGLLADDHHPDCIQAWSVRGKPPTSDLTIVRNMAHGDIQGIGLFDHGTGGFERVTIEHNVVATQRPQAIAVYACRGCAIRWNDVSTLPDPRFWARITADTSILRCGNVVVTGVGKRGVSDPPCKGD